jgi:KDO2-lipid IV(A) lauroyltransferase
LGSATVAPPVQPLPQRPMSPLARWVRHQAGDLWLNLMFFHARHFPWIVGKFKPFWMWGAWTHSHYLQDNILCNARRLLGEQSTPLQREALGRAVVSNFFDFISDIGKSVGQSREQLLARIDVIEGEEHYHRARQSGKGAIVLTAHMGSFEVGMAALLQHEPRVHVLFQRDSFGLFEKTRSALRRKLGVIEQCVNDGLATWVKLRDALTNNEAVLIQGDRVMPGQKGQRVPMMDGHMVIPTGPVRLAIATGAPIIPIFSIRLPNGIKLFINEPIVVADALDAEKALAEVAAALETYLRRYPDQWLMVHRAWCEDAEEQQ